MLSPEGWPYASSLPADDSDPGRFHALFGRDSLIASLELMPARPDVARATLRALAATQGTRDDEETDEEPGKIVHELRTRPDPEMIERGWPFRDGELRYYGSADGTAWFLVVLERLGDAALARELEGAWRAAAGWLERALERGGGLVRHGPRRARGGLVQQGWRDSEDPLRHYGGGILAIDGSVPPAPLADADSQAVAVAALRSAAALSGEERYAALGRELSERIAEQFSPETMAIDSEGRPVQGAGSQLGWLLWADALPQRERARYAERLCAPDVLTGRGLRTLSSEHPRFSPGAYHRGAVWPFDCWLGWGGLRAAGREREAEQVRAGVLAAIEELGRYPELYAVDSSDGVSRVPIANTVQAWTVGARWALEHRYDGRG